MDVSGAPPVGEGARGGPVARHRASDSDLAIPPCRLQVEGPSMKKGREKVSRTQESAISA